jgi:nucleotide-binding universal stress UspA family protein
MLTKILVPVDFSACSAAALRHALALKQAVGASLDVVHTFDLPTSLPPYVVVLMDGVDASLSQHAERYATAQLAGFLTGLGADEETRRTSRVLVGPPAPTLLEAAVEGKHDLIVMGTHARTGLSRFVIGSTAEKLLRAAPCPVLTVRAED